MLVYAFVDHVPFGWRFLFIVGGFGLLCVPWLWRSLQETQRFSDRQAGAEAAIEGAPAWGPLREIVQRHGGRLAALIAVVLPVALILEPGSVFVSKHLQDELGYSPGQVGLLMALCGAATPIGNVISGTVSDRYGRRPVTIAMSLALSLAIWLFYNGGSSVAQIVGLGLMFMSLGAIMVLHAALATELFPTAYRSTAAGVREATGTIGASAGLWLLSLLYGVTGSHPDSITWILILTPISPLVLLFVPETAGRELEEIAEQE